MAAAEEIVRRGCAWLLLLLLAQKSARGGMQGCLLLSVLWVSVSVLVRVRVREGSGRWRWRWRVIAVLLVGLQRGGGGALGSKKEER